MHGSYIKDGGNCSPFRTNRTDLKEDYYAVWALKQCTSADGDYDDDFLTFLAVESISERTFFFRLQLSTPEQTKECSEEIPPPLVTSTETASVMGICTVCFLWSGMIQEEPIEL